MSTTRLPEIPEARIESYQTDGTMRTTKLTTYDEFDMHAYGLAVWKAAMEAAAQLAESDEFYGNATQHLIAEALRALPLPEQGSPQERRE